MEFKISMSTMKASSKPKTWILWQPTSICSEPSYEEFHGRHLWRAKELVYAGSYSRTTSWKQWSSLPFKVKGRQQNKRAPWLNNEILGVLKSKKEAYQLWKGSQMPIKDDMNLARACSQEGWGSTGTGQRCQEQQERVLQLHDQKAEAQGICRPIAKQFTNDTELGGESKHVRRESHLTETPG